MSEPANNPRVFIGGIGGGIGSTLANVLSSQKWTVGGFGRPSDKWSEFKDSNDGYFLTDADATDEKAVAKAFSAFKDEHGGMDAYVHAIGSVFLKNGTALSKRT